MKKIRKGDVVVIGRWDIRPDLFGEIGIVINISRNPNNCCIATHVSSNGGYGSIGDVPLKSLEVIDNMEEVYNEKTMWFVDHRIDDEKEELVKPRVGDVVVINNGCLGEIISHNDLYPKTQYYVQVGKYQGEDTRTYRLGDFEVIDHIDEDPNDTGYRNEKKLPPVPEGYVEIKEGTVQEGDWVATKGYWSELANDLIGCAIPVRNDTGYWKIYRDAKLIQKEPKFMAGYNGPKDFYNREPNVMTKDGPVYDSEPLKDNEQAKPIPKPKFKVGDRVIVYGKDKDIVDCIFREMGKEFRYSTRNAYNIFESDLCLDTEPIEKSKPKEWSVYNAVTLNGIEATVELDGTKVIVTCKNCKHIIKTVDLKE